MKTQKVKVGMEHFKIHVSNMKLTRSWLVIK